MYATLIGKIKTTLATSTKIAKVYPFPVSKIDTYPAAVFIPATLENSYLSTEENMKVYRFKVWVVAGAAVKGLNLEDLFGRVLANAVDDVIAKVDDGWNQGTIEGHRVWSIIESGNWSLNKTEHGVEAIAELNLAIKVATNN